jgi:hypothetical protein
MNLEQLDLILKYDKRGFLNYITYKGNNEYTEEIEVLIFDKNQIREQKEYIITCFGEIFKKLKEIDFKNSWTF